MISSLNRSSIFPTLSSAVAAPISIALKACCNPFCVFTKESFNSCSFLDPSIIGVYPPTISSITFEKASEISVIVVPLDLIASSISLSILLPVPITKPAIVMTNIAVTPIVHPSGPVPKAINEPVNPRPAPIAAFITSITSPSPAIRFAIPVAPKVIPEIINDIPRI